MPWRCFPLLGADPVFCCPLSPRLSLFHGNAPHVTNQRRSNGRVRTSRQVKAAVPSTFVETNPTLVLNPFRSFKSIVFISSPVSRRPTWTLPTTAA